MSELFGNTSFPILLTLSIMLLFPLGLSQLTKRLGLPNIIAYLIAGILLGPSILNILQEQTLINLEFITHMVLGFWISLLQPLREIGLSILLGGVTATLFILLTRLKSFRQEWMPLSFGVIILVTGISQLLNLSEILSGMVFGLAVGNYPKLEKLKNYEEEEIGFIIPLFYILFFTLAGANLHLKSVPALGLIGLLYVGGRIIGKTTGAYIGASLGGFEAKIRKYLGFGILSQAGVAIGLALVVKHRFQGLGPEINDAGLTMGDDIGNIVFTVITATSVIFEIIGPILAKYALEKSGEAQV